MPTSRIQFTLILMLFVASFAGCKIDRPTLTPTQAVSTPDPALATPQRTGKELGPLCGSVALILMLFLVLFVGCASDASTPTPTRPVNTPDLRVATPPQTAKEEEPLQGRIPDIPDVFVVPQEQSKAELADYLKTTPDTLEWVNPGLPEPVPARTVVVIPPIYRAARGETLAGIADKTGLPEDLLRAANPDLSDQATLDDGTLLVVPPLFIASEDTLLSGAADTLQTSTDVLLSANPELAGQDQIRAGTVLVAPLPTEEGH